MSEKLYQLTYPDTGAQGQPTGVVEMALSDRQVADMENVIGRPGARLQSIEPIPDSDDDGEGES